MRLDKVLLVFRKDFQEISRNKEVILPMLILPLVIGLFLPAIGMNPENVNIPGGQDAMVENMLAALPEAMQTQLMGYTPPEQVMLMMLVYLFAPFFLVIPLMSSSVIAADSFAGEKERNTLEALLATPITDSELLLGKILVSFIPGMGVTIFGFILYVLTVNVLTVETFGQYILPTVPWLVLIFVLSPAISLLGIGTTVIVSSRVKGFREAQQLSALLVIPVIGLLFGQGSGYLMLGSNAMIILALFILAIDVVIFRFGLRLFQRENILSKSK
ncbi:ABC transporter permease [Candidatus Bathyarchaeota archaeon]|jgi:ABC-2 type transport system permease protein|nr:ABC transporter permease [Candidatus Bathyarchaeota archaeon]MBT4321126.1 ABC transporter permease [Candidatus Bathyarchaeota archaeon]MBT4424577.1 ABC transporter permease [Candidatus Bathyarchaeota archaeon]MBT6604287.1 ABC transporter permease [Candidatus Bathyarchaeota archaeon]MBT7187441.1 ABC transporter permease [Candidatus Bathyarchaeota archaeon]